MRHGLTRRCTIIDANIETMGMMLFSNDMFGLIKKRQQRRPLIVCRFKERDDMAFGNDETVTERNWVLVSDPYAMRVVSHDPGCGEIAEGTGCLCHHHPGFNCWCEPAYCGHVDQCD